MTESYSMQRLLLPELEAELDKTRKTLERLPDGHLDFKAHEKSFTLARLAGHTAEMPSFLQATLTSPDIDLATAGLIPLSMESRVQLLAEFNERADKLLTTFKQITDETFEQAWKLSYKGQAIFSGTRYEAYRSMGMNHMIHHRAQLGVSLRLLNSPVPALYGPSADEQ